MLNQEEQLKELLEKEVVTAPNVSKSDIPFETAKIAHYGTSFEPEARAYRQQLDYVRHMNAVYKSLEKNADTEDKKELLKNEFERYRKGYIERQLGYLNSHSRIASTMITGGSNFPARTMEKRNNALQNKLNEWLEWDGKAQTAIAKKINPIMYSISSDRADAVVLLKKELEEKQKKQDLMVSANKIIRKKHDNVSDKIKELQTIGISEAYATELLKPDYWGVGFPSFSLTNNNANIKRIEGRIKDLEKRRSQTTQEFDFDGGIVIDNVEENRIQIKYNEKPSYDVIQKLKSRGFHWSPTNGTWQRMRSNDANYATKYIVGNITKRKVEEVEPIKEEEIKAEEVVSMPEVDIKEDKKLSLKELAKGATFTMYKRNVEVKEDKLSEISISQIKDHQNNRSNRSKSLDNSRLNGIVIEPTDKRAKKWLKDSGSMDIRGIDTPNKTVIKHKKNKRNHKGDNDNNSIKSIK